MEWWGWWPGHYTPEETQHSPDGYSQQKSWQYCKAACSLSSFSGDGCSNSPNLSLNALIVCLLGERRNALLTPSSPDWSDSSAILSIPPWEMATTWDYYTSTVSVQGQAVEIKVLSTQQAPVMQASFFTVPCRCKEARSLWPIHLASLLKLVTQRVAGLFVFWRPFVHEELAWDSSNSFHMTQWTAIGW